MTSEDNETPELRAWRSLANAYRAVYAKVNSDLRQYGLTLPQYSLMRIVGRSETGSLEMNEIAKELLVTLANVTVIADNLERRGYLIRVRGLRDRRVVRVELTSRGRSLWERISAAHRSKVTELMKGLSSSELRELSGMTDKVREKILGTDDVTATDAPMETEDRGLAGKERSQGRSGTRRGSEAGSPA